MNYGTDEQKRTTCRGWRPVSSVRRTRMTEPHAGSDVQAIRTRAVRDGEANG